MNEFEINLEQTIDELFGDETFGIVDEQLFRWFLYSFVDKGRDIGTLDAVNYLLFKEKLNVLLDAVYQWQVNEIRTKNSGRKTN